jgi:membrane protease YdiL (CAAX protease family)
MTFSGIPNPFLTLTARRLLLVSIVISIGVGASLGIAATVLPGNLNDAIVSPISYTLVFGLLCAWVLGQFDRSGAHVRDVIGRVPAQQNWWQSVVLVIGLLMFSLGTFQVSFYLLSLVAPAFVETVLQNSDLSLTPPTDFPWLYRLLSTIVIVVVAPIAEEFVFRGILLQRWVIKWGTQRALLASAIVFGVLHANVIGLSMFGWVMGLLYLQSRTLIVPIVCHALNNALALGFGSLPPQADAIEAVNSLEPLRSNWWTGLLLIGLSLPGLIWFTRKNLPRLRTGIPYLANAMQSRGWR